MSKPIEDYGLIGNMLSCALVARDGSIDWLCLPRFDSDACFAALLGTAENGAWRIAPVDQTAVVTRAYRPGTPILETTFETEEGSVTIIDFMPLSRDEEHVNLVRIVRGNRGRLTMRCDFTLRFGYGSTVPWVQKTDFGLRAVAGPDAVELHSPVKLVGEDMSSVAEFPVEAGDSLAFVLAWHPSHRIGERDLDPQQRLQETEAWWREWSGRYDPGIAEPTKWHEAVQRSLITLKALTFAPTGGIVAAATTSLPEEIGGERNWDYRYCWIRDATLTLYAFLNSGYLEEAEAWREWMLRATAGHPAQVQIMYGLAGERRLTEIELAWLPGYEGSRPVRIGNGAHGQLQIDVYGELIDALHAGRKYRLRPSSEAWAFQRALLNDLRNKWRLPDQGIWEVRGPARHFTHSKLMAWVAFDRGIRGVEDFGLDGPAHDWKVERDALRTEILSNGWSEAKKAFVQSFGSDVLDASLLLMPLTGFLPPDDPRIVSTVDAIQTELIEDGLVLRYRTEHAEDGLRGREGTFLVCSFWLADALTMMGRIEEASAIFEKLLGLRNDLGLLAEQYDPRSRRQLGNFPQAFSHLGIVNTAHNLMSTRGPAEQRADRAQSTKQGVE
ncbi:glycoside hydrolase family 15 protein [Rhizobium sp. TRM95796]|uniref:glycoside hydrolase family 15 protein n=1 Tax=Rhizobium sp. TRM95796 TaxID=2979862 RepID=UPI0021E70412|nr:glycoside hydrolase family 15 protein [Rhizobium sp. TRM95796]MCV3768945.1 glycoside hydrolase family 15 protein [Rhizobium sp. TRM95796]